MASVGRQRAWWLRRAQPLSSLVIAINAMTSARGFGPWRRRAWRLGSAQAPRAFGDARAVQGIRCGRWTGAGQIWLVLRLAGHSGRAGATHGGRI
ncbi:hypothetical protein [Rhodopseudomonas faecalis]|uniref:hypothetical protein n=1 Tax=Rhodopseudomonas faecalis TaxID=99655 RepID=UPI000DA1250B|nr:hypothetical protein [Rhodopseudomonas faecalis]